MVIFHSLPIKNGDFPSFLVCFPSKSPRSPPTPVLSSGANPVSRWLAPGCLVVGWWLDGGWMILWKSLKYLIGILWLTGAKRREWKGCWGLLGLLIGIVDHSRVEIPGCTLYNPQNDFGGFLYNCSWGPQRNKMVLQLGQSDFQDCWGARIVKTEVLNL